MRIALTYPHVNRTGGIERVLVECANLLVDRGHDVHVLASRWDDEVLSPAVHRHDVRVPQRPDALHMLEYHRRATALLKGELSFVDVHASFGDPSPVGGVFWVPSVHRAGLEVLLARRGIAGRTIQRLNPFHRSRLWLEGRQYRGRRYARVLANGPPVKQELIDSWAVPEEDIVVRPPGYDPLEFSLGRRDELRDSTRRRFGIHPDQRVVLFVGNELERKGFDSLLSAVAGLRREELQVLVVGGADHRPYLGEIQRLGLEGRVRFVARSGHVASFYAAADVFALPTRYEPWGLVVVEALASGLPVLTTKLAGASIAVKDGLTGQLIDDPNDVEAVRVKLAWLLDNHAASAEEINASVAWLSWPAVIQDYERLLAESVRMTGRASDLTSDFAR